MPAWCWARREVTEPRPSGRGRSPGSTSETSAPDRFRWIEWGVVGGLLATVVLSAGFPFASCLGTGIPGLFVAPFAMLSGGSLGFALATIRDPPPAPTDVDPPSVRADAASSNGNA